MREEGLTFLGGLLIGACILGTAFVFTSDAQDNSWRDQIAEHGCAEYYLDQNHDRQWRWKDEKPQ